jgi:hypothetical protein
MVEVAACGMSGDVSFGGYGTCPANVRDMSRAREREEMRRGAPGPRRAATAGRTEAAGGEWRDGDRGRGDQAFRTARDVPLLVSPLNAGRPASRCSALPFRNFSSGLPA